LLEIIGSISANTFSRVWKRYWHNIRNVLLDIIVFFKLKSIKMYILCHLQQNICIFN